MSENRTPEQSGAQPGRPEQETPEQETPEQAPAQQAPAPEGVDAERQIAELEDNWRRAAAELDNFRKRCARDVVRAREDERARVAARWLPVVDNLERALEHASADSNQVIEGVRAVHQQAQAVLAELGFPRRDDVGRPFDPALHEAVSTVNDEELVPGTVADVVRAGYGPDNGVLRPAAVVVATRSD